MLVNLKSSDKIGNPSQLPESEITVMSTGIMVKVKLSRYTPWRRLGERRYSSYSFSTSALDGG
jgi:hypothetical protein